MCTASIFWIGLTTLALAGCADIPGSAGLSGDMSAADVQPDEGLTRIASDIEARGDTDTALALYQRAAAATPAAATYDRLGDAYLRADRLDDAARSYRAALGRDPNDSTAMLGLGSALVRRYRLAEGIGWMQKAAPGLRTALAYNRLGVAQTLAGRLDEAKASLTTANQLGPDDLDVTINLALATALAGDAERAVDLMRRVVQSPHLEARQWRNLVMVAGLAGHEDEGRAAAARTLKAVEVDTLLRRAASIRALGSPRSRGQALGSIDASTKTADAGVALLPPRQAVAALPAEATAGGAGSHYLVQITARRSEGDAKASFDVLQARYPAALAGREPIIRRTDLGERGVFFRAQVGPFSTISEGAQLCDELKSAGGECIVRRD
jgi:Flp pilus assembly protein TadD